MVELSPFSPLHKRKYNKFAAINIQQERLGRPDVLSNILEQKMAPTRPEGRTRERSWLKISTAFFRGKANTMSNLKASPTTILSPVSAAVDSEPLGTPGSIPGFVHFPKFPGGDDLSPEAGNNGKPTWPRCDPVKEMARTASRKQGKPKPRLIPTPTNRVDSSETSEIVQDSNSPENDSDSFTCEDIIQSPQGKREPASDEFRAMLQRAFEEDGRNAPVSSHTRDDVVSEIALLDSLPSTTQFRLRAEALLREFEENPFPDLRDLRGLSDLLREYGDDLEAIPSTLAPEREEHCKAHNANGAILRERRATVRELMRNRENDGHNEQDGIVAERTASVRVLTKRGRIIVVRRSSLKTKITKWRSHIPALKNDALHADFALGRRCAL